MTLVLRFCSLYSETNITDGPCLRILWGKGIVNCFIVLISTRELQLQHLDGHVQIYSATYYV